MMWRRAFWALPALAVIPLPHGGNAQRPVGTAAGPPPPETLHSRPGAGPQEQLYLARCAPCHGAFGMGTGLLARRSEQPMLERRTDLEVDFIMQAARTGIGNMPAIPRGEVSDDELRKIAEYLARKKEGRQ
jgi:mono/diheme cytochrome c family protein